MFLIEADCRSIARIPRLATLQRVAMARIPCVRGQHLASSRLTSINYVHSNWTTRKMWSRSASPAKVLISAGSASKHSYLMTCRVCGLSDQRPTRCDGRVPRQIGLVRHLKASPPTTSVHVHSKYAVLCICIGGGDFNSNIRTCIAYISLAAVAARIHFSRRS